MDNQTIEKRLTDLESDVAELKSKRDNTTKSKDWTRTIGLSENDPGFDEMIRLGREYREQQTEGQEPDDDPGHRSSGSARSP